ncbi:MAG: DNA mismatch repair protein [Bacteroidales bacterium]|nr:DNA mismatch repair protein [Bacteroidales bacterium]
MAFKTDSQTLNDLRIIVDNKSNDIYSLFNKTVTRGGANLLKEMFLYPLSQEDEILKRTKTIKYFRDNNIAFPFKTHIFDSIEYYLSNTDERTRLVAHDNTLQRKINSLIGSDTDYKQIKKGVTGILQLLIDFNEFINKTKDVFRDVDFHKDILVILNILDKEEISFFKKLEITNLSYSQIAKYDQLFRFTIHKDILTILRCAYSIDVFVTVAQVSKELDFSFAEVIEGEDNRIEMYSVWHPLVQKAVPNDITITEENNMIFLTGANMAGKSTFMKTFSIALYLAHTGFPVPAKAMRFSVQNGMYTTINLSDNINLGFSHFYAEVLRVKKVAESVHNSERLVVVFDELFRGTNVKDAYEATVAVANAFAGKSKCSFIISSHIIEAGESLKTLRNNIRFLYLPTVMKGNTPEYTYKLQEGITNDRHGMLIIRNEKILDILKDS